jgi:putative transcriptional regulator
MISERQQEQASLFALGALAPEEEQSFAAELLTHPELRDLVRNLQATVSLLAFAVPPMPLPPSLKDKVLRRIDAAEAGHEIAAPLPPAAGGLTFIHASDQSGWKPLPIPGAFIKLLSLDRERGSAVLLGKLAPGARYPAHLNVGSEDFYILTGDLFIGDRQLVAGDFHHADRGSQHEENYSMNGCTLLAVLTTDDPLVAFALA